MLVQALQILRYDAQELMLDQKRFSDDRRVHPLRANWIPSPTMIRDFDKWQGKI